VTHASLQRARAINKFFADRVRKKKQLARERQLSDARAISQTTCEPGEDAGWKSISLSLRPTQLPTCTLFAHHTHGGNQQQQHYVYGVAAESNFLPRSKGPATAVDP